MNSDSFFTIGSTHKVCQDYVIHSPINVPQYVILSDGCSSAVDSDFGSRILCKSLQSLIYNEKHNIESMLDSVIRSAHSFAKSMLLNDDSLCATLVFARIEPYREGKAFKTYTIGDSMIAAKHKFRNQIEFIEYKFASGAPYYLRYEIDNMKEQYFQKFGNEVSRRSFSIDNDYSVGQLISVAEEKKLNFDKIYFEEAFSLEDYDWVAVMSDGATSFQKLTADSTTKQNIPVGPMDALYETLSFKGYFGEFVQRRCQKAFKQFKEKNIHNYDDFSIGVISNVETKL